jgi:hypothetical protein
MSLAFPSDKHQQMSGFHFSKNEYFCLNPQEKNRTEGRGGILVGSVDMSSEDNGGCNLSHKNSADN